jgi:hypothetical protein
VNVVRILTAARTQPLPAGFAGGGQSFHLASASFAESAAPGKDFVPPRSMSDSPLCVDLFRISRGPFANVFRVTLAAAAFRRVAVFAGRHRRTDTSSGVFLRGHGLKVIWIAARSVAAEVVKTEPFWDRSLRRLERGAMDSNARSYARNAGAAVALMSNRSGPSPAGRVVTAILNDDAPPDVVHHPLGTVRCGPPRHAYGTRARIAARPLVGGTMRTGSGANRWELAGFTYAASGISSEMLKGTPCLSAAA